MYCCLRYATPAEQPCRNRSNQTCGRAGGADMTNAGEAFEAILGLVVGGILFIAFGTALAGTTLEGNSSVNFEFWGALYILVAIVLAVVLVSGIIFSLFNGR